MAATISDHKWTIEELFSLSNLTGAPSLCGGEIRLPNPRVGVQNPEILVLHPARGTRAGLLH